MTALDISANNNTAHNCTKTRQNIQYHTAHLSTGQMQKKAHPTKPTYTKTELTLPWIQTRQSYYT